MFSHKAAWYQLYMCYTNGTVDQTVIRDRVRIPP